MCGILGAWGTGLADRVADAQSLIGHRGPDDSGLHLDVAVHLALAHTRLAIQDVSPLGHQPMWTADGTAVVIFNGEIYNFRELRQDLESQGHVFVGSSDTEVLLALYQRDGTAMLSRLNGIFAFAIWDAGRQTLFAARDALGVKPFYYYDGTQGFAFASELKALVSVLPSSGPIDPAALQMYLAFLWCPGHATPLRDVRRLGPGEALVVSARRIVRHWKWYQPTAFRVRAGAMSETDAVRGTERALRIAVHRQLVSDVPVGAFLSGGLDSSAVVAFAREHVPEIRCFTIETLGGTDRGVTDDLPYARRVAAHLRVPLEVVSIDSTRMAGDLESMVYQLDEPIADPATLNVLYISQLARRHDIKVLLSGVGGDDLFAGYRRHLAVSTEKWRLRLPASVRSGLETASGRLDQRRPFSRRIAKLFRGALLEGDARLVSFFIWTANADLKRLYSKALRESLAAECADQPMLEFLAELPPDLSRLERLLALEQRFFLADHNLIYTDKMSMAAGVEVRVPFLDLELVEWAATVPDRFKLRGRETKWVLKKTMEPHLPHDIIYRAKTGFGAPLRQWMRRELREMLGDLLSPGSLKARGLFDTDAVQALIRDNDAGVTDGAYTLFSLLCVEIWCRRFAPGTGH